MNFELPPLGRALCILGVLACHKSSDPPRQREQPTATTPAGSGAPVSDASVADAAPASFVELLRAVPATVRVSSRVRNKDILPEHLVDQNRDTAWNSASGKLVGSWIEISVDGARVHELKMTVGHTGRGPRGEDYFTMNPRIRQVALDDAGKPLGSFDLDITSRDLQSIKVHPKGTLRITVTQIEPGSKKSWREIAVSELEVWGTPDATWTKPAKPRSPWVLVDGATYQGEDPCAGVEEEKAEGEKSGKYEHSDGPGGDDHAYPPECGALGDVPDLSTLPAPWSSGNAGCKNSDEIYGPQECSINFRAGNRTARVVYSTDNAKADIAVANVAERDVIPGGSSELVVRFKDESQGTELLGVCRQSPTLACTAMFEVTGLDDAAALAKQPLVFPE